MKAGELGIRESDGVTDDVLAARLRAGDPEAMGEIYDRYADRIRLHDPRPRRDRRRPGARAAVTRYFEGFGVLHSTFGFTPK